MAVDRHSTAELPSAAAASIEDGVLSGAISDDVMGCAVGTGSISAQLRHDQYCLILQDYLSRRSGYRKLQNSLMLLIT